MPFQHSHVVKAGSTGRTVLVYLHGADGEGRTGLQMGSEGFQAAYVRESDGVARAIAAAGGFSEVDPDLLPGVYELGVPDEALAVGSERVLVMVQAPGVVPGPVQIDLVAYDPQDPVRMGVLGLADAQRHEFLRRALPRLTEQEFEMGVEAERALQAQRSDVDDDGGET